MVSMATQTSMPGSDEEPPLIGSGVNRRQSGESKLLSPLDSIETAFPLSEKCQTKPVKRQGLNKIQRLRTYNENMRVSIRNHSSYQEQRRSQKGIKRIHSLYVNTEMTEM